MATEEEPDPPSPSEPQEPHPGSATLMDDVYQDLHGIAQYFFQSENSGHTLQPTALIHEAWIKMAAQKQAEWNGRSHFLAVASNVMRRLLVDHARRRKAEKRGGGITPIELEDDIALTPLKDLHVLAVDDALTKLAAVDPDQARIVELRFFGGLTMDEIAETTGMSKRTLERQWTFIRAWLRKELGDGGEGS